MKDHIIIIIFNNNTDDNKGLGPLGVIMYFSH